MSDRIGTRLDWQGDLDDECAARVGDLFCHCEAMRNGIWYCAVHRVGPGGRVVKQLFHSGEDDVTPKTGEAARRLCELVVTAWER